MKLARVELYCLFSAFLLPLALAGQTPPKPADGGSPPTISSGTGASYPAEAVVFEHLDTVYNFAPDGTGWRERTIAVRIQSEAAVRTFGVVSVPYAGNSEQVEFVYARVRHPDGSVIETQAGDAIDMPEPVTREAPLYSDLKEKQLPIKSLRVGDTLEWKARITRTKPEAPNHFWGQESFTDAIVVLSQSVELRVPAGVYVNVWSPSVKPTESTSDGQHIYRWTSSQLKPTVGKEADAEKEAKKKQILTADEQLEEDEGKLPSIAWTNFKSWDEVGSWYRTLEADRTVASPEIKSKVAELITGKKTDEEKARVLYAFVSAQIRYIGVDFGVGRYQPHTAAEILSSQYGDCKDKHTLLATMLGVAGIDSRAVLIGAGIRFNSSVPSPAAFNHVITQATVSGEPMWLDTTAEIAPYRMLIFTLRDKQALVVPDTGTASVEHTPRQQPFPSMVNMDAVGSLDANGTSHSRLTLTARGDIELILRAVFHQSSPGQYNDLVQRVANGMGYAGTTSNPEISRPDDTDKPFKMSFDYEREKAGDWPNYRIIAQLMPVTMPRFEDKDPLVRVLDLGYPGVSISTSAMKLPAGWGAELPEAIHLKSPYATIDVTYRLDKGTVYAERRIEVLKQKVPVNDLKTYKKWSNDADLDNEPYIQLTRGSGGKSGFTVSSVGGAEAPTIAAHKSEDKPNTATSSATPIPARPDNENAASLLRSAYEAMIRRDFDTATQTLDQVQAINSEQTGLWAMYGSLAMQRNSSTQAVQDFEKEIKLHPGQVSVYPMLAAVQVRLLQRKEAMNTLRAWISADPSNLEPTRQLMEMMMGDGDFAGAAKAGEAALENAHPDQLNQETFKISLGNAQIKAGEKEKGRVTLEAVLKDAKTPVAMNDAAYWLADASLDLPLAEAATRSALDKLADESNAWTLDEDQRHIRTQTRFIRNTWDTIGVILFHEGKLADAQSYLEASWAGNQSADTAEHLGDLALVRGNKTAAVADYELALVKRRTFNQYGVKNPPSAKDKEIQSHIDALIKTGAKSSIGTANDPDRVVQKVRTIQLGPESGHAGNITAEYLLLLKNGKATKVKSVGDKQVADAEEILKKAKFDRLFPANSTAALVLVGYLNCHSGTCDFVIEP